MARRSVYIPDPPPQRKVRSSFNRSAPPWPQATLRPTEKTVPPSTPPVEVFPQQLAPPAAPPAPHPEKEPRRGATQPTNGQRCPGSTATTTSSTEKAASPPPHTQRLEIPPWILQVRDLDLVEIAEVLGFEVEDDRVLPCPRCGDESGAEVYRNKKGWTLWRCRGCSTWNRGNLDLASYALAGEKAGDLDDTSKALLQQWFADQGWCDPGIRVE